MLRLATASAGGNTKLLAMALVQPVIGQIDAGVGHVRQVATAFHQVGLAGQVAPDDPYLMPGALATQLPTQLILVFGGVHRSVNLPAQLTGGKAAFQLAGRDEVEQHPRITTDVFDEKITGGADAIKGIAACIRPSVELGQRRVGQSSNGAAQRLVRTPDKRQEDGGHIGQQREAHGLSLIGVLRDGCRAGKKWVTKRIVEQKL